MTAFVALITPSIEISAQRTFSLNKSIRKECLVLLAVRLYRRSLLQVTILVKLQEDILGNIRLLLCRCTTKDVEANLEPLVDFGVNLEVLVA